MPFRRQGGYSHWTPNQVVKNEKLPRIFYTRRSAINAVTSWCLGRLVLDYSEDGGFFRKKVPGRNREDLEIVECTLNGD